MGQEIKSSHFSPIHFQRFHQRLTQETQALLERIHNRTCSHQGPIAGWELEAWLIDDDLQPAPKNTEFLHRLDSDLACPELARFNIEFNHEPLTLTGPVLSRMHEALTQSWTQARQTAATMGLQLAMIGTLPTLRPSVLNLDHMSDQNRYRALNEQILSQRGEPVHLDIVGHDHLKLEHHDVMLESAATSFQLHWQVPLKQAVQAYNASILASAPLVALSANSPYLFEQDLWDETRIPLFEQAIEVGGYQGASHGPLRRVNFGSGYAQASIAECFEENLQHFPALLPMLFSSGVETFEHLRLHNGTIWRWNRPLVGFDSDGTPHIRIEQRVIPAGPTVTDTIANAAFFYGLATTLSEQLQSAPPFMPFTQAKDNFYQAARHGLKAHIVWKRAEKQRLQSLLLEQLIPEAEQGLCRLGIDAADRRYYLGIIRQRVTTGLNGCEWQRRFIQTHGHDFKALLAAYLEQQVSGRPVHKWKTG